MGLVRFDASPCNTLQDRWPWEMDLGLIGELSLVRLRENFRGFYTFMVLWSILFSFAAESDYIGTVSFTYRIQADTCRESAATNVKFSLTGIPVSIQLGTPIFRYEPAGTARTGRYLEPCYHHGRRRLRGMDRHKWRVLHHILKRTHQDIKVFLDSMKELEEKVRPCYEGQIGHSSNEFVEMMVLDGCFVLELFQGAVEGFKKLGYSRNDPVFAMRGLTRSIQRDMIMLENQLPLFLLDRLLGLQYGQPHQRGLVAKLAIRFSTH
ncbi:hypothetical protein ACSBR1_025563 [Camellia fascicularis]